MLKRVPRKGNPYYPLPPDYPELTGIGQRDARVSAVAFHETPDDLVRAWAFFRSHYLFGDRDWYKHGVVPSPPAHYQIVHDLGRFPYNVWAAPRSYAKSTILAGEIPLMFLLSKPHFETVLVFPTLRRVVQRFDLFMQQIENNQKIVDDFGKLKPKKGSGQWNHSAIKLPNGSAVYGIPVEGKMLGERPHLLLFDDVEYDDSLVANPAAQAGATERFEKLMTVVAIPMMEADTCIGVIGTTHNRKFYIYHMLSTKDPSYRSYNKRLLTIEKPGKPGELEWPEKFTWEFLNERRAIMKDDAFFASYYNRPPEGGARVLQIHPELCQYEVPEGHPDQPFVADNKLISYQKIGTEDDGRPKFRKLERPFKDAVRSMYRILTVDYAPTTSFHSDFSCALVMGFENSPDYKDTLWVLDIFLGKVRDEILVQRAWDLADKWKVKCMAVESIGIYQQIFEKILQDVEEKTLVAGWAPRVIPIRYPAGLSKPTRIMGLGWRFTKFRVKLPMDRQLEPGFRELYQQIRDTTETLNLLINDDAVDCLAMAHSVVRPRRGADTAPDAENEGLGTPREYLEKGELRFPTGIPAISSLGVGDLDMELVHKLRQQKADDEEKPPSSGWRTIGG